MASLPSSLSLSNIADGSTITASPHRSNYSAVQTALNALITILAAGSNNQVLTSSGGTTVGWSDPAASAGVPTGTLSAYVAAAAPSGWLLCDGSAVSRTTYAVLYAVIGNTYGAGDGSSTFNVPDMRGRVPTGYASGGHTDVATLANNDGTALANRRPKHKHTVVLTANATSSSGAPNIQFSGNTAGSTTGSNPTVGPQTGAEPTDTPAYLVVNWIVKT